MVVTYFTVRETKEKNGVYQEVLLKETNDRPYHLEIDLNEPSDQPSNECSPLFDEIIMGDMCVNENAVETR